MEATCGASPIKRRRRTKRDIDRICGAMFDLLEAEHPMSVRQVFYRLVSMGVIPKSEKEYQGTVCRLLGRMRRERELPFHWIADATRWQRKPSTHSSLQAMLERTADTYRQAIWDDQQVYVEVWLEKDALAGVLYDVTAEWDVPLMVTRGYPSISYVHNAAEAMEAEGKPVFVYYFGDHDPSGVDIPRKVEADLREFAPDLDLTFIRAAVNPDQIIDMDLQTRPTKRSDTRSKGFVGESVEVDAIPPNALRQITRDCIEQHVDRETLHWTKVVENQERETLEHIIAGLEQ